MNDLQASLEAARPPPRLTPAQERVLRTLAPRVGGLEGALLRLLLGCYDDSAARLAAVERENLELRKRIAWQARELRYQAAGQT
jgi:hypothetical protein